MCVASGDVQALQPYQKTELRLIVKNIPENIDDREMIITISSGKSVLSTFHQKGNKGNQK